MGSPEVGLVLSKWKPELTLGPVGTQKRRPRSLVPPAQICVAVDVAGLLAGPVASVGHSGYIAFLPTVGLGLGMRPMPSHPLGGEEVEIQLSGAEPGKFPGVVSALAVWGCGNSNARQVLATSGCPGSGRGGPLCISPVRWGREGIHFLCYFKLCCI